MILNNPRLADAITNLAKDIGESFPCSYKTIVIEIDDFITQFPDAPIESIKELTIAKLKLRLEMGTL